MSRKYAADTSVPVERSKSEVEKILQNYGADQFTSGWTEEKAVLMFRLRGKYIRIEMPIAVYGKAKNKVNHLLSQDSVAQENRRRWRAMVLYVKAKLESVASEIVGFEEAFLAHIVLPNRQTVGQFMVQQIEAAYKGGDMPKMISGGT